MGDQFIGLFERALVEQKLDALPGRHAAFFVLFLAALGTTAFLRQGIALFQFGELLFQLHGGVIIPGG